MPARGHPIDDPWPGAVITNNNSVLGEIKVEPRIKVADVASTGCPFPKKRNTFMTVMMREYLVSQQGQTLLSMDLARENKLGLATVIGTFLMYLSELSDEGRFRVIEGNYSRTGRRGWPGRKEPSGRQSRA